MFFPMLLALTGNGDDVEKRLEDLVNFIQTTQAAVQSLRSGMETFHTGFAKISQPPAPQYKPAGPEQANKTVNNPTVEDNNKKADSN